MLYVNKERKMCKDLWIEMYENTEERLYDELDREPTEEEVLDQIDGTFADYVSNYYDMYKNIKKYG
jgi:hypothetical protein